MPGRTGWTGRRRCPVPRWTTQPDRSAARQRAQQSHPLTIFWQTRRVRAPASPCPGPAAARCPARSPTPEVGMVLMPWSGAASRRSRRGCAPAIRSGGLRWSPRVLMRAELERGFDNPAARPGHPTAARGRLHLPAPAVVRRSTTAAGRLRCTDPTVPRCSLTWRLGRLAFSRDARCPARPATRPGARCRHACRRTAPTCRRRPERRQSPRRRLRRSPAAAFATATSRRAAANQRLALGPSAASGSRAPGGQLLGLLPRWRGARRRPSPLGLRASWNAMPVPAGIRRPTMTFSFSPRRSSRACP